MSTLAVHAAEIIWESNIFDHVRFKKWMSLTIWMCDKQLEPGGNQ